MRAKRPIFWKISTLGVMVLAVFIALHAHNDVAGYNERGDLVHCRSQVNACPTHTNGENASMMHSCFQAGFHLVKCDDCSALCSGDFLTLKAKGMRNPGTPVAFSFDSSAIGRFEHSTGSLQGTTRRFRVDITDPQPTGSEHTEVVMEQHLEITYQGPQPPPLDRTLKLAVVEDDFPHAEFKLPDLTMASLFYYRKAKRLPLPYRLTSATVRFTSAPNNALRCDFALDFSDGSRESGAFTAVIPQ